MYVVEERPRVPLDALDKHELLFKCQNRSRGRQAHEAYLSSPPHICDDAFLRHVTGAPRHFIIYAFLFDIMTALLSLSAIRVVPLRVSDIARHMFIILARRSAGVAQAPR